MCVSIILAKKKKKKNDPEVDPGSHRFALNAPYAMPESSASSDKLHKLNLSGLLRALHNTAPALCKLLTVQLLSHTHG